MKLYRILLTLLGGSVNAAFSQVPDAPVVKKDVVKKDVVKKDEGDYYFPSEALGEQKVDLSHFSQPGKGQPGQYQVDIFVNNEKIDSQLLRFVADPQGDLQPQLTVQQYEIFGLKITSLPAMRELPREQIITDISHYAAVTTRLNIGKLRLDIAIPQLLLNIRAKDYVDPSLWNTGMPAAFVSYDFSGSETRYDRSNHNTGQRQFLNLRNGLNIAGWRLRNYATWRHEDNQKNEWNALQTYLEKDIFSLRSTLAAGDTSTSYDVMDGFGFRGLSFRSTDAMLPASEQGYSPVIRGIAMTPNARVSVRQGDVLIYEAYVPAGAFAISDLGMVGSGRMDITVTENDGRIQRFSQSFGRLSVMQRAGHLKYDIALGEYRQNAGDNSYRPRFVQMTALYGLPNEMTLYGGGIVAQDYYAARIGLGVTLGMLGTAAFDVSTAETTLHTGDSKNGQAWRVQYSKNFPDTGTGISLAGLQYQGQSYYTFTDAGNLRRTARADDPWGWTFRKQKKSRLQFNIQQQAGQLGSLSLNAWQEDYHDTSRQRSAGASWNFSIAQASLGLSYSYSKNQDRGRSGTTDQVVYLAASLPFSVFSSGNSTLASWSLTSDKAGNIRQTVGISGTALERNNLSYSTQQTYSTVDNEGYGGSFAADYRGRMGAAGAAYSYGRESHRLSYGARGAVVAHPYGINLAQRLSEGSGYALIRAPGAAGVAVSNVPGVATDWRGYAVVPYVQPYRKNRITLDASTYDSSVDITMNTLQVIPAKEALVLANYQTQTGARALITLLQADGAVVPFGASAVLADGSQSGIVGDKGAVYLAGLTPAGTLHVSWGSEAGQTCRGDYTLANIQAINGVSLLTVHCR